MLYNYIAILFFAIVAVFVPYSMLLTAKMLRRRRLDNPVKNAPYESGEKTIGKNRDIINEYLPYFMLFLPFEVVALLLLLWAPVSKSLSYTNNLLMIGLAGVAMLFAFLGYLMMRVRYGRE